MPEVVWRRIEHTVIAFASVLVEMARWLLLIVELSVVPPLRVSRRLWLHLGLLLWRGPLQGCPLHRPLIEFRRRPNNLVRLLSRGPFFLLSLTFALLSGLPLRLIALLGVYPLLLLVPLLQVLLLLLDAHLFLLVLELSPLPLLLLSLLLLFYLELQLSLIIVKLVLVSVRRQTAHSRDGTHAVGLDSWRLAAKVRLGRWRLAAKVRQGRKACVHGFLLLWYNR